MAFQPSVDDVLTIRGAVYRVPEHPASPGSPYAVIGRQSIVYQLVTVAANGREVRSALKVFEPNYRAPSLAGANAFFNTLANWPGLRVCKRDVLAASSDRDLLREYPDLSYAVLMPWIAGPTWMEVMLEEIAVSPQQSLKWARTLAEVLVNMEEHSLAHCDLTGGNILIPDLAPDAQPGQLALQLVDVEEMYAPALSQPAEMTAPLPGYSYRKMKPQWRADADRFAGALLLAEMLGWCDEQIRGRAWGEHYFDPAEIQQQNSERYQALRKVIRERWGKPVASLLKRVWRSENLANCPTFCEWLSVLPTDVDVTVPYMADTLLPDEEEDSPLVETKDNDVAIGALLSLAGQLESDNNIPGALAACRRALAIPTTDPQLASEVESMIERLQAVEQQRAGLAVTAAAVAAEGMRETWPIEAVAAGQQPEGIVEAASEAPVTQSAGDIEPEVPVEPVVADVTAAVVTPGAEPAESPATSAVETAATIVEPLVRAEPLPPAYAEPPQAPPAAFRGTDEVSAFAEPDEGPAIPAVETADAIVEPLVRVEPLPLAYAEPLQAPPAALRGTDEVSEFAEPARPRKGCLSWIVLLALAIAAGLAIYYFVFMKHNAEVVRTISNILGQPPTATIVPVMSVGTTMPSEMPAMGEKPLPPLGEGTMMPPPVGEGTMMPPPLGEGTMMPPPGARGQMPAGARTGEPPVGGGPGKAQPTPAATEGKPEATPELTSPPVETTPAVQKPAPKAEPTEKQASAGAGLKLNQSQNRDADAMVMVAVPSGTFRMGSTDPEIDSVLQLCKEYSGNCEAAWFDSEQPAHEVTLQGFWIDSTEVTNSQFVRFLTETVPTASDVAKWIDLDSRYSQIEKTGDAYQSKDGFAQHPVSLVSWDGARAYCQWTGGRLPTEAEWEYAARGPESRIFPWGNEFDDARLNYTSSSDGYIETAPVGSFQSGASWTGALDMAGNVSEWTTDWFGPYQDVAQQSPQGPALGQYRVNRGGNLLSAPYDTRTASRSAGSASDSNRGIGFRCVVPTS